MEGAGVHLRLPNTLLPAPLQFSRILMLGRFVFAVALAKLLRNLLARLVDGDIKVRVMIFRKQVRPAYGETDTATKLFLRSAGIIILDDDTCIHSPAVEMLQLVYAVEDVLFDSLGEFDVMRR